MGGCCTKGGGDIVSVNTERKRQSNDEEPSVENNDSVSIKSTSINVTHDANKEPIPNTNIRNAKLPESSKVIDIADRFGYAKTRAKPMDRSLCALSDDVLILDDVHLVVPEELGYFMIRKMNNKTLDRIWIHLDKDGTGEVDEYDILNVLQWMAVLYVAFVFRVQYSHNYVMTQVMTAYINSKMVEGVNHQ